MSAKLYCCPHQNYSPAFAKHRPLSINRRDLRRQRRKRATELRCQFGLENLFSTLSSVQPLDLLAPVLGLASVAAAVYLHRSLRSHNGQASFFEWALLTSPTLFNRRVLLRCPSVSLEDCVQSESSVNAVSLCKGRVPFKDESDAVLEGDLEFQRIYLSTDDGGVISLDWPDYLDLEREKGLDTTVLIIPGTPKGSMDRNVVLFVLDAVKHGFFPIVMNPRGCAGSSLTTARIFTAADSDDICAAVKFVSKIRPWTTMIGIGWGYGSSMLIKYLAESRESTQVVAVVCIDTPFDLDEFTKSSLYNIPMNEKLTCGLREILRANKELFQGTNKGFEVSKALSSTSIREFDAAISMISYGFDSLEDFYRKSSTRQLIGNLKIPVLFIQSNDATVPLFSVPRSSITDNLFTSLLLCSCSHLTIDKDARSALLWCQQISIEWLSAVEHTLVKGHYFLQNDLNITIKSTNGSSFEIDDEFIAARSNQKCFDPSQLLLTHDHGNVESFMKLNCSDNLSGLLLGSCNTEVDEDGGAPYDTVASCHRKFRNQIYEIESDIEAGTEDDKNEKCNTHQDISTKIVVNSEGNQVTQIAAVMMNILDAAMPGTLDDEEKKKILGAMEQGETFMKALQGAVPDDVRGKITTAVAEIMQCQGANLNFNVVKEAGWTPNVTLEHKSKIYGKLKENFLKELDCDETPLEQAKFDKSDDTRFERPFTFQEGETFSESFEVVSDMEDKASHEKFDQVDCRSNEQRDDCAKKTNAFDERIHHNQVIEDDLNNGNDEAVYSLSQLSISSSIDSKESPSVGSSVHQMPWEKGNQNSHDNSAQDGAGQNVELFFKSDEPLPQSSLSESYSMSVPQALDALTGFDDSTQMAVNTVFGVIENLIDQLEKSNQKGDEAKKNEEQATRKGFNDSVFLNEEKSYNVDFIKRETRKGLSQPAYQTENPLREGCIESAEDGQIKLGHSKGKFTPAPSSDRSTMHSKNDIAASFFRITKLRKHGVAVDLTLDAAMKKYWLSPYAAYLHRYIKPLPSRSLLDLEMATDLYLDPEEDQWKMIDQPLSSMILTGQNGKDQNANFASGPRDMTVIEPFYAILDAEYSKFNNELSQEDDDINDTEQEDSMKEKHFLFIKNTLLGILKVEIHQRMNIPDSEEIDSLHAFDLESFTDKVSRAIVSCGEFNSLNDDLCDKLVKFDTVERQKIVQIILSALQDTSHLRKVLSFDFVVCSSLASLRTYFQVVGLYDKAKKPFCKPLNKQQRSCGNDLKKELSVTEKVDKAENEHHSDSIKSSSKKHEDLQTVDSTNGSFIIGAATTALGASTVLESYQKTDNKKNAEETLDYSNRSFFSDDEFMQDKRQKNIVSSLAEKAMFVAAPVVPTKPDGKVDHERLAAILAGLGQKGGLLRSVGKVALLWGGIYGALRLTNKLITFLHIAERPLFQRVFGFVCMVLVLWSPVVIPLLPALVQSWTTHNPIRSADVACTVGFYIAAMILVILWGKKIRGYDNPIEQYGLDLTTTHRVFDFLKGMAGGFMIVSCIHLINALLGYAYFTWPAMLPLFLSQTAVSLRACGSLLLLVIQGIVPSAGISVVEELLFRSWLPEEIAADLGYNYSVIISGIIFALTQRSLPSFPGFLLLSICLSGIKQRAGGKLAIPVGIRTGVMAASFVVQRGDLLGYRAGTPPWIAGPHHLHPFDGPVGMTLCAFLAILFFPKLPYRKIHRPIRKGKC